MNSLYETYRPRTWDQVVGQDKAITRLQVLASRGIGGRAFWITGASGSGKTTIARILAGELADQDYIQEIDAAEITPARLRDIEDESRYGAFGKGGRVYIVNESHGLRKDAVRQFLVLLERIPNHVAWIFTTTTENQEVFEGCEDAAPLLSRCISIPLSRRDLCKPFAQRVREIAQSEGLDGRPIADYEKLLYRVKLNFRAALQAVESGEMLI